MVSGGGEYSEFRVTGDDRRIFWGLKFSIPGLFWVGEFGKYFFLCVARFKKGFFGVFKTISRFLVVLTK